MDQPEMLMVLYFLGMWSISKSYEDNKGAEPQDWLHFVDDFGNSHVMNFSFFPGNSSDGFVYGDAYFYLYTRNNSDDPEMLSIPDDQLLPKTFKNNSEDPEMLSIPDENSNFTSVYLKHSTPLVAITHGWMSNNKTPWLQDMRDAFLKKTDINVITVDWSELSKNPGYHWAAMCTRYVGKKLAKLINAMTECRAINSQEIHLIGHSLGAHVMGYAGMFSNQRIQRITGLDPARPLFEVPLLPTDFRLDRADAEFVDIIHTSGGIFGYESSHGHADFYPNNGTSPQPGCEGLLSAIQSCSHGRSCLYFEESIGYESGGFVSYPCQNWETEECNCKNDTQLMGYPVSAEATGDYYLRTRNESKFAIKDEYY